MEHTQEYLNSLTKAERGELWIQGVLAKQPDYNVQDLKDIWSQTENTHETYEQEADKIKYMLDGVNEAYNIGFIKNKSISNVLDEIEQELDQEFNVRYSVA